MELPIDGASYFEQLNLELEVAEFGSGGTPGVRFNVKNEGDRTVSLLLVRVVFLDEAGEAMGEDTVTVVWVDAPVNLRSYYHSDPLRPNYSIRSPLRADRFHHPQGLGHGWQEGSVRLEVAEVHLAE